MKVARANLITECRIDVKALAFKDEFGQDVENEEIESILIEGVEITLDRENMAKLHNIISESLTAEDYE